MVAQRRWDGASLASVCSGAAAFGGAGLLDGRRCTTHWGLVDAMRARYPAAKVQDGVPYVHDGPISTSAGIAAGVDLALSLVERQHGPALTAGVARELVVYLRRNGSTAQVGVFVQHRAHLHQAVHRVEDHLAQRLDTPTRSPSWRRWRTRPLAGSAALSRQRSG